jgi:catalase
MVASRFFVALAAGASLASAACPYMQNDARDLPVEHPPTHNVRRDGTIPTDEFLAKYEVDDSDVYLTSDVGGPISDQNSLRAGDRGP